LAKAAAVAGIPFFPVRDPGLSHSLVATEILVLGLDGGWHVKRMVMTFMRCLVVYLIVYVMWKGVTLTFFMSQRYSIGEAGEDFFVLFSPITFLS